MRRPRSLYVSVFFFLLFFLQPFSFVQASGGIVINEILYDCVGTDTNHEWIEVWNNSPTPIDLTGWKFYEAGVNHGLTLFQGDFLVPAGGYAVLTSSGSVFLADHPAFSKTIIDTTFSLNNTGETISLKDASLSFVDTVSYTSSMGGTGNGKTLERNETGDFLESVEFGGTPGYINSVYNQNNNTNNGNDNINGNGNSNTNDNTNGGNTNTNQPVTLSPGDILINEIYPAPSSNSNTNEWIELYNTTDHIIDLSQVTIDDNTANPESLFGSLPAQSYLILEPSPKSLNNDGDRVLLQTGTGAVIDQVQYGSYNDNGSNAPKSSYNQSLGRYPNLTDTDNDMQDFRVFGTPTKGGENIVDNHSPIADIVVQYPYKTTGTAPFSLNLTGEDSYDPDGDMLTFFWDYGDGYTDTNENPLSHKFFLPGSYTVNLTVTDTWGASAVAHVYVTVTSSSSGSGNNSSTSTCSARDLSDAISISEILPNPVGSDSDNEFIEIVNYDTRPVNLCGWQLDDKEGGSSPYHIPYDLFIQPGEYRVFIASETKLAFNNDEDEGRILNPFGVVIDHVFYSDPPEGKSYARIKNITAFTERKLLASLDMSIGFDESYRWVWQAPTPGEENDKPVEFQGIVINELFPNPEGLDTEHEFIEIKNTTSEMLELAGWWVADASGSKYKFLDDLIVQPGGVVAIPYQETRITLNNDKDTVELYDENGGLQDTVSYAESIEGKSYSRFIDNPSFPQDSTWEWSVPTEGRENEREVLTVEADIPAGEYQGAIWVTLTTNKPGAKIFYSFDGDVFPEDQREYNGPIRISATTELWFFAFIDEQQATQFQTLHYTIIPPPLTASGAVMINELYPNPKGADATQEWIELWNSGDAPIDLSAWYITNKHKKIITLPEHSSLASKGFYVVEIIDATFSLTNTSDMITLYDHDGNIVDQLPYNHVKTGQSLIRLEQDGVLYNIATPTDYPTKGAKNIDGIKVKESKKVTRKTKLTAANIHPASTTTAIETESSQEIQIIAEDPESTSVVMGGFLPPAEDAKPQENIYLWYFVIGSVLFLTLFISVLFIYRKQQS